MSRRFSVAIQIIQKKYKSLPEDLQELKVKIEEYQQSLDHWGLKDYQINNLGQTTPFLKLLYTFLHGLIVWLLAAIPTLLLNMPVGFAAKVWAQRGAAKDLKSSRVKLTGRDLIMSKRIIFSIGMVPILFAIYGFLLFFFTELKPLQIVLLLLCLPLFSYLGVAAVEAGMVDLKDLRPAFLRLLPSFRKSVEDFPLKRADLSKQVRTLARKYGPELGALYYDKQLNLTQYMQKMNIEMEGEDEEDEEALGEGEDPDEAAERKESRLTPGRNATRSVEQGEFAFSTVLPADIEPAGPDQGQGQGQGSTSSASDAPSSNKSKPSGTADRTSKIHPE